MIPKILHQIWIQGFDKAPSTLKAYSQGCKRINEDFEHMMWDETAIRELLKRFGPEYLRLYNSYHVFAQKADFARYAILYVYGGIYLDMDMVCRRDLNPMLEHNFFCTTDAFYYLSRRYLNGIIGSVPEHPLFAFIFRNIFARTKESNNVTYSTGTGLLYDSVKEYISESGQNDITVVPSKYLHPCQTYDDDSCPYSCDSCYVAHTNYGSWNSNLVNFLMRNLKNIFYALVIVIAAAVVWLVSRRMKRR
ncbi:Glycosyltransferase [uncultured virus]|nr:Glycosyltransferase [uncultured virus]